MLNLPQFLFINGPAGSGKSTLANLICSSNPQAWREGFAEPIREMIYSVFFPEQPLGSRTLDLRDQGIKNANLRVLANLGDESTSPSVRQVMIDFSESFLKPRLGDDVFGRLLFRRCQEQSLFYKHFIIEDSGFFPEAEYVVSQVGAKECLLIRLHRDGCNYSGDSRGYIDLAGLGVGCWDLDNNGTVPELLSSLHLILGNL